MGCEPTFQAQAPSVSGETYGWYECVYFSGAMGIDYDTCGAKTPTGGQFFRRSGDPSALNGGTLEQARTAAASYGVALEVHPRILFTEAEEVVEGEGRAGLILVGYNRIHLTQYSGDVHFTENHAELWLPGYMIYDPLRNKRANSNGVGPVRYPRSLLRAAAGDYVRPIPRSSSYGPIGQGYCQIAFFPHGHNPRPRAYDVHISKAPKLRLYVANDRTNRITDARWITVREPVRSLVSQQQRMKESNGTEKRIARLLTGHYGDAVRGHLNGYWVSIDSPYVDYGRIA